MTVNPFNPTDNTGKKVNQFHTKSDVDSGYEAQHHTLGWKVNQAASGHDVKTALDGIDENVQIIQELITELQATQADLLAQTAILDKVGKRIEYFTAELASYNNAPAAPYNALVGYDTVMGDTPAEVGVEYSGGGLFTCLETGSYDWEVAQNWDNNGTGRRILFVTLNVVPSGGNSYYRFTYVPDTANVNLQFHKFSMALTAGDVVRFAVFQDSGGTRTRAVSDGIRRGSTNYASMIAITRILGQQ